MALRWVDDGTGAPFDVLADELERGAGVAALDTQRDYMLWVARRCRAVAAGGLGLSRLRVEAGTARITDAYRALDSVEYACGAGHAGAGAGK